MSDTSSIRSTRVRRQGMAWLQRGLVSWVAAAGFGQAVACDCVPRKPGTDPMAGIQHLFLAQVVSAELSADRRFVEAKFVPEQVFRGDPAKVSSIRLAFSDAVFSMPLGVRYSCPELALAPGMHVLVQAEGDGVVTLGTCTKTRVLQWAEDPELVSLKRRAGSK